MNEDLKAWIAEAKQQIEWNDEVIAWASDPSMKEYHWDMTKRSLENAKKQNEFLKRGVALMLTVGRSFIPAIAEMES